MNLSRKAKEISDHLKKNGWNGFHVDTYSAGFEKDMRVYQEDGMSKTEAEKRTEEYGHLYIDVDYHDLFDDAVDSEYVDSEVDLGKMERDLRQWIIDKFFNGDGSYVPKINLNSDIEFQPDAGGKIVPIKEAVIRKVVDKRLFDEVIEIVRDHDPDLCDDLKNLVENPWEKPEERNLVTLYLSKDRARKLADFIEDNDGIEELNAVFTAIGCQLDPEDFDRIQQVYFKYRTAK